MLALTESHRGQPIKAIAYMQQAYTLSTAFAGLDDEEAKCRLANLQLMWENSQNPCEVRRIICGTKAEACTVDKLWPVAAATCAHVISQWSGKRKVQKVIRKVKG